MENPVDFSKVAIEYIPKHAQKLIYFRPSGLFLIHFLFTVAIQIVDARLHEALANDTNVASRNESAQPSTRQEQARSATNAELAPLQDQPEVSSDAPVAPPPKGAARAATARRAPRADFGPALAARVVAADDAAGAGAARADPERGAERGAARSRRSEECPGERL